MAIVAGLYTVVAGARSLPDQDLANATVESDLRFYAAFYVGFGAMLVWAAPRVDRQTTMIRGLAAVLLLAGLARAGAWLDAGRPDDLQLVLLAIELAAPVVIVIWQAQVSRAAR